VQNPSVAAGEALGFGDFLMPEEEPKRIVETPVEARQGFLDRPVLVVLLVSLALVITLFGMIYGGIFGTSG
jgi:hypothetical protein